MSSDQKIFTFFPPAGGGKYLDIIEKAVGAYTPERIDRYIAEVEAGGIAEHGFPRLCANIAILLSAGKRTDLSDRFLRMADICCLSASESYLKNGRKVGNDFSVRELCTAVAALEAAGLFPDRTPVWRAGLSALRAEDTYSAVAREGEKPPNNWALFAAASEQARIALGFGGDPDFVDRQIASQLFRFDENGMYIDPHAPMVYDLVSRAVSAFMLRYGYRGRHADFLRGMLDRSVDLTVAELSVDGEIPFGGRSNQMIMTEGWYAVVCEYYLSALPEDDPRLGNIASCLELASSFTRGWLSKENFRHVKNFFPGDSDLGCEGYAYFDKYMATLGSIYYLASLVGGDRKVSPVKRGSFALKTGPAFHKIFLSNGRIFAEFELDPDFDYDAGGLGRIHFEGAPPQIALSVPCPSSPRYSVDPDPGVPVSVCPYLTDGEKRVFASGRGTRYEMLYLGCDPYPRAVVRSTLPGGAAFTEEILLDGENAVYRVTPAGYGAGGKGSPGSEGFGIALPVFAFDGRTETEVTAGNGDISVTYLGSTLRSVSGGVAEGSFFTACNRNGRYLVYGFRSPSGRKGGPLEVEFSVDAGGK